MSVDFAVYLQRDAMLSPSEWQRAITAVGFPIELHPDFDPNTHTGWLPCKIHGEDSGFEYYSGVVCEEERDPEEVEIVAPDWADFRVLLVVKYSETWETASAAASGVLAVLAEVTGGVFVSPASGESFTGREAIAWAAQFLGVDPPFGNEAVP